MQIILIKKRILLFIVYLTLCSAISVNVTDVSVRYGIALPESVMVPMRDSVKLATDIYIPMENGSLAKGKFPVVLRRTPYNKKSGTEVLIKEFVRFGYIVVIQDVRGRCASEGIWHYDQATDKQDGYDTAEWIAKQSWSNGKMGMAGASSDGITQHAMAMAKPDNLTTVIPVDSDANLGTTGARYYGAFSNIIWYWVIRYLAPSGSRQMSDPVTKSALSLLNENVMYYLNEMPLRRGTTPLKFAPEYEEWLVEAMEHGANDDFWKESNIIDYPQEYKDIPVFLIGGWYDFNSFPTVSTFKALNSTIKGPVYLWMGPWTHNFQISFSHEEVCFGKDAALESIGDVRNSDVLNCMLIWYDHFLKGIDNEVGKKPPFRTKVRIFVMGTGDGHKTEDGKLFHGGYWREENDWPLKRATNTEYYLHNNGSLSIDKPNEKESGSSYQFDPEDPVPTIGGNNCCGWLEYGAYNQWGGDHISTWGKPIPISARNDVIVFQSEPLDHDIEVTGEISVKLWISSDALDTDFTGKLIDVYPPSHDFPNGFDMNIVDGIIRARFRNSLKEENLMEPGKMYELIIELGSTSNVFKKNHRIRVDISSSNFPRFDVNPNTGEPLNDNRLVEVAINSIYHDQSHPSHIILPVIK